MCSKLGQLYSFKYDLINFERYPRLFFFFYKLAKIVISFELVNMGCGSIVSICVEFQLILQFIYYWNKSMLLLLFFVLHSTTYINFHIYCSFGMIYVFCCFFNSVNWLIQSLINFDIKQLYVYSCVSNVWILMLCDITLCGTRYANVTRLSMYNN